MTFTELNEAHNILRENARKLIFDILSAAGGCIMLPRDADDDMPIDEYTLDFSWDGPPERYLLSGTAIYQDRLSLGVKVSLYGLDGVKDEPEGDLDDFDTSALLLIAEALSKYGRP